MGRAFAAGCVLSAAAGSAHGQAPPPAVVALTGGRVITGTGPDIENGTVLIRDGVIAGVGADVELPYDAVEVDVRGKVVMASPVVAISTGGLDIPNESLPVTPFLNVYDAIDPASRAFEEALRLGHAVVHIAPGDNCVIGGVGRVIRPIGRSVDDMTILPDASMVMSTSPRRGMDRMSQMALLRETFAEYGDYTVRLAEQRYEEDLAEKGEKIRVGPEKARELGKPLVRDEDFDDQHANLMRLLRGEFPAWVYCDRAMDVSPAVGLVNDNGIAGGAVLVVGTDAHKAVDVVKESGLGVVLNAELYHRERDVLTGDLREVFVPKVFADAGVEFAMLPSGGGVYAERELTYQAAVCVREGVSRADAVRAITLTPAKVLGIDDRFGTIEAGKSGTVVVYSGDPLEFSTWVEDVYIDGVHAYDRDRDHVLQRLLKLDREVESEEKEQDGEAEEGGAAPEVGGDAGGPAEGGDAPAKGAGEGGE